MQASKAVVLIAGARGRLGRAIAARLAPNYSVVGFELSCTGTGDGTDCIEADLASAQSLQAGCAQLRVRHGNALAAVIHLAAFYEFSDAPNRLCGAVNVQGTALLTQALRGFEVQQFIDASTMLVHAPSRPDQPIDETAPLQPAWPYPQSKLVAEQVVLAQHGTMAAVILRIAGVYTDRGELPSLAWQIARIYQRQLSSHAFPGETAHGQALVHIDDVASAVLACVERRTQLQPECSMLAGRVPDVHALVVWHQRRRGQRRSRGGRPSRHHVDHRVERRRPPTALLQPRLRRVAAAGAGHSRRLFHRRWRGIRRHRRGAGRAGPVHGAGQQPHGSVGQGCPFPLAPGPARTVEAAAKGHP